jgi:hypothetical protein
VADGEPDSAYAPLPARKLLTSDVEDMKGELRLRWSLTDVPQGFPVLGTVWVSAEANAVVRLAEDPADAAASNLMEDWAALDRVYGEPTARRWSLSWSEGFERFRALVKYLAKSGLTGLATAEADAPEHYFTREELGY